MECPNCGKPMKTRKEKLTNDYIKELDDKELTIYFCDCCDETFFDVDEFDELLDKYRSSSHKDEEEIPYEKILEARTKYGLTQEEMSFILNKPVAYIQKIESGERKLRGLNKRIYTNYLFQGKILEFVEKYKDDIPENVYNSILEKINNKVR